jgi:hypothetical protein
MLWRAEGFPCAPCCIAAGAQQHVQVLLQLQLCRLCCASAHQSSVVNACADGVAYMTVDTRKVYMVP